MVAPFVSDPDFVLYVGDALDVLRQFPDESVHCGVTSPPYWGLRDYGVAGQLGLEATPELYVARMVEVFREMRRVLRSDGTFWLNVGDSYSHGGNGSRDPVRWPKQSRNDHRTEHAKAAGDTKRKDLVGIPWRLAFALQADGWYLRADIIWSKPNPMPESVTDRPTKAHEYLFLLTRSPRYFYDADAIREEAAYYGPNGMPKSGPHAEQGMAARAEEARARKRRTVRPGIDTNGGGQGGGEMEYPAHSRNKRSVWHIATEPYAEAHFATFPLKLVEPCIKAGCPEGGTVLDCFAGSGTTALVARRLGRKSVGIELNETYAELAARRLAQQSLLAEGAA